MTANTDKNPSELSAQARLREMETRFDVMADSIPQLAWMAQRDGWIFWYNKRWYDYTGTTLEDMQGWGWRRVHHPDHVDRVVAHIQHSWQTGDAWEDTFPLRSHDGKWRWFLSRALPITDDQGNVVRWFGTNTDITELREANERQQALLNELNHRVKNTLAIVQSLAQQTLRNSATIEEFGGKFTPRLLALSRAHNMLAREVWEGASLQEIVEGTLAKYATSERTGSVSINGPVVRLGPTVAVTLAMIFHELAANAEKFGSLSRSDGNVTVNWRDDWTGGDVPGVEIIWQEQGGPTVTAPQRRGLGSRLIEHGLATEAGATGAMQFLPEGLHCTLRLPLSSTVVSE